MVVAFYDLTTGLFSDLSFIGSAGAVVRNTPAGQGAIEGVYDVLTQRVDIATGDVVAYTPPPERLETRDDLDARVRIRLLEDRQARTVRELLLDPMNATVRARLQQIEDEIVTLRQKIKT